MQEQPQLDLPLGKMIGLATCCLTILVGVFAGHNPEVIAIRTGILSVLATCGGYVVGKFVMAITGNEKT